jgi:hypothetical protein
MPEQWRTIEVPFQSGLSQKEDDLWQQPGGAAAASNLIAQKRGSLQKRPGLKALSVSNAYVQTQTGGQSVSLVRGIRMASLKGNPTPIIRDTFTDGVYSLDENSGSLVLRDRIPEAYVYPWQQITGSQVSSFTQVDTVVCNGYEIYAWPRVDQSQSIASLDYVVFDAHTGAVVRAVTSTVATATNSAVTSVKLAVCGTNVVMSASTATTDFSIYAWVMDCTAAQLVFTHRTGINLNVNDAKFAYDIAPVVGDTTKLGLLYYAIVGGVDKILYATYTVATSGFTLVGSGDISGNDAVWTADNGGSAATLIGVGLRVDSVLGHIAYVYSWTVTVMRVSSGVMAYPFTGASVATAVNLMGTVAGSMSAASDIQAYVCTIEYNSVGANYSVRMSPGDADLDNARVFNQLPYIATWQAKPSGGAMTISANQPRWTFGVTLWSHDFQANGISYVIGFLPSKTQGGFFLFADDGWNDVTTTNTGAAFPLRLVASLAPRLANPLVSNSNFYAGGTWQSRNAVRFSSNPFAPGGNVAHCAIMVANSAFICLPSRIECDFASQLGHQSAELGANMLTADGSAYDGSSVFELAFPYYPVITGITMSAGGQLSAGIYSYIAVYEWVDAAGQRHRSGRGAPFAVTATINQQATLTIACMGFSAKLKSGLLNPSGVGPQQGLMGGLYRPNVAIKIYRTQVNGVVYNNIASNDGVQIGANNSLNTSTVTPSADGQPDTSIIGNALLYGDGSDGSSPGNILDNLCPPASQACVVHQNRPFFVDGPRIWPGKAFTYGEGAGVNEATAFSVDDGPGNVLGLASLDGYLIIFKSDRILYMSGLGPADNGTGNDWSPPQRIASDVGLVDWRSIVSTPDGIYFMSPAGRRLLTRDLQVRPVPSIEDLDATYPAVTSAAIHPTRGLVVWTQNTDDVSVPRVGIEAIHGYVLDAWTQAGFNGTAGCVSGVVAGELSSGTVKPVWYGLLADGTVIRENLASNLDLPVAGGAVAFVVAKWTSPWIKSDGLQGWSNWRLVRLSLQSLDPANVTVTIAYNYNAGAIDTRTWTAAQVAAATEQGVFLVEIRPTQPRAAAIRITIVDSSAGTTVTGAGFKFQDLRVDYDYEQGGYRAPSAQRG